MAKQIKESLEDRKERKAKEKTDKYVKQLADKGVIYNPDTKLYGVNVGGVTKIIDEEDYLYYYS